jgi:hypothetical protein
MLHHSEQACVTKLLRRGVAETAFQTDRPALSELGFRLTSGSERLSHFGARKGEIGAHFRRSQGFFLNPSVDLPTWKGLRRMMFPL